MKTKTGRTSAAERHGTQHIGTYLAARLSQIGLRHHFALAADFNLVLLDQLLTNKKIEQVYRPGYVQEGRSTCEELFVSQSEEVIQLKRMTW